MKTINIKLLPQTGTKPARFKIWADGAKTVTMSVPLSSDNLTDAMVKAVKHFKLKQGWTGKMVGGHTDAGMVFVFVNDRYIIE